MDVISFQGNIVVAIISAGLGAFLAFIVQRFLNKRGLFTYNAWHNRVGISTDDSLFGSVRVTWNDKEFANLYISTVELRNESLNDYENVTVKVYTTDTTLLTERAEIVGTIHILDWSKKYKEEMTVIGSHPTDNQIFLYSSRRDYEIQTFNRGQLIRFTFLNSAKTDRQPTLWLDILHKGVKTKFRVAQNQFWGVKQESAAIAGSLLGLFLLVGIIIFIDTVWFAALISLFFGLFAIIPGALLIKLWYKLRDYFGG